MKVASPGNKKPLTWKLSEAFVVSKRTVCSSAIISAPTEAISVSDCSLKAGTTIYRGIIYSEFSCYLKFSMAWLTFPMASLKNEGPAQDESWKTQHLEAQQ